MAKAGEGNGLSTYVGLSPRQHCEAGRWTRPVSLQQRVPAAFSQGSVNSFVSEGNANHRLLWEGESEA